MTLSSHNSNNYCRHSALVLLIFLAAAYLLPYHVRPLLTFYNDWLAIAGVALAWAIFVIGRKHVVVSIPSAALIPVGLSIVIAVQAAFGMLTYTWDVLLPICYLLVAAGAVVFGATLSSEEEGATVLTRTLVGASLFSALISVVLATLQFVQGERWLVPWVMPMPHNINAIRPYANLGQSNQLALLFGIAIASLWWLFQEGRNRASVLIAGAIVLIWGLALTQSKIGWLISSLFVIAIVWSRRHQCLKPIPLWVFCMVGGIYLILIISLPNWIAPALGNTADTIHDRMYSDFSRITMWQHALEISTRHPWFGAGWFEFGPQQLEAASLLGRSVYAQHSHNIVLNFAAELGWPLTLGLVILIVLFWFKSCFQRRLDKNVGFAWLLLLAVAIHSMVEYPLWYGYILVPVTLMTGLIQQVQFSTWKISLSANRAGGLFLVSAIGLVGIAAEYRKLVIDYRAFGFENYGLKAEAGSTEKPSVTIFPQFYDFFQFTKMPINKHMTASDLALMERVSRRFGFPPVLMNMSLAYALNEKSDDAYRTLLVMNRLHYNHYNEVYTQWSILATRDPRIYANVLKCLPEPTQARRHYNDLGLKCSADRLSKPISAPPH